MTTPRLGDIGLIIFSALAAMGFAGIVIGRVRLAVTSYRLGNRFELVRSTILAFIMSLFVLAATYVTVLRLISALSHTK